MAPLPPCYEQIRTPSLNSTLNSTILNTISYYSAFYAFPVIFVFGIGGNLLNLIVFGSRGMRNKANCFLSSMAVADLGFFLMMFLLNLTTYDIFFYNKRFLYYYYHSKSSLLTLSNWFSSASIWFAVMVTIERLIAIRFPLRIRLLWTRRRITFIILFISLVTLALQIYNLFWYSVVTLPSCSMPNVSVYVLKPSASNHTTWNYVNVSMYIAPTITVFVPLIIMAVANGLIIYFFRLNSKEMVRLGNYNDKHEVKERKITVMVVVIVLVFILCNLPSAVVYIIGLFKRLPSITTQFTNYLVCVNKALNFFLYCCASKSFRKKCKTLFVHCLENICHCGRGPPDTERLDEEHGLLMTTMSQALTQETTHTNVKRSLTNDSSVRKRNDR